jgi:peptidoglycan/xylan/chitin deacetylase (PgdA/CDA1 family)
MEMSKREIAAKVLGSPLTNRLWRLGGGRSGELRILAYHRVLDDPPLSFPFDEDLISADTETFRRQMEFARRNFDVISFGDLLQCEREDRRWPARALIVTFDDGYRDNYTNAFPVLSHLGLSATIFLASGHIGEEKLFWWDRVAYLIKHTRMQEVSLPEVSAQPFLMTDPRERRACTESLLAWLKRVGEETRRGFVKNLGQRLGVEIPATLARGMHLSWDEVRQMADGGIEFASHTVTHPILAQTDEAQLRHEICESKETIEQRTGRQVLAFAFPAGRRERFNKRSVEIVAECGYQYAVAYDEGVVKENNYDRYTLPRIHVERDQSLGLFRANLMFPRLMVGRTHAAAKAVLAAQQAYG